MKPASVIAKTLLFYVTLPLSFDKYISHDNK